MLDKKAQQSANKKVLDDRGERAWLEDVCTQYLIAYLAAASPATGKNSRSAFAAELVPMMEQLKSAHCDTVGNFRNMIIDSCIAVTRQLSQQKGEQHENTD